MKGILVTLALLQLVVVNEGMRLSKLDKTQPASMIDLKKLKVTKSCPRNPKLEAMKKALGLATRHTRRKRSISSFPASCLHVGIVEFDDGLQYVQSLYDCCDECHFPNYVSCILNGNPGWLCASRAYQCICDCREAHLAASEGNEEVALRKSSSKPKKKALKSASVCKRKTCSYGSYGCCIEDQCIKLYPHKGKSFAGQ